MRTPRLGVVYVVKFSVEGRPAFKVGKTTNFKARVRALRRLVAPSDLQVVNIAASRDIHDLESRVLTLLKSLGSQLVGGAYGRECFWGPPILANRVLESETSPPSFRRSLEALSRGVTVDGG